MLEKEKKRFFADTYKAWYSSGALLDAQKLNYDKMISEQFYEAQVYARRLRNSRYFKIAMIFGGLVLRTNNVDNFLVVKLCLFYLMDFYRYVSHRYMYVCISI